MSSSTSTWSRHLAGIPITQTKAATLSRRSGRLAPTHPQDGPAVWLPARRIRYSVPRASEQWKVVTTLAPQKARNHQQPPQHSFCSRRHSFCSR